MPKDMPKQHFLQLLPKLRFPEFDNAPAWEEKKLGEVCDFLKGKNLSKSDIVENGKYECIRYGELYTHYGEVIGKIFSKTNLLPKNNITSVNNDVLIPSSGETSIDIAKASAVQKDGIILGGDLNILRGIKNGSFLSYYLNGSLSYQIAKMAQGSSVVHLYASQLKSLQVFIPSLAEQQKIADCLSSLDGVIALEGQKLVALKDHKKGLMQNLFPSLDCSILDCSILDCPQDGNPQEGNPQEGKGKAIPNFRPNFRFPEFQDDPAWEEINIGSIGKVSMCKRILKNETKSDGDIPFYKIGTFGKQADAYISREIYENYKARYSYPKKGDILISASGTIGRLVVFDGEVAYFQDSNIVWVDNDESFVKNRFLFYCYDSVKWATDDNTISRLYNNNLRTMKILTTSLAEQQKIADCLSSLDGLITAQAQKIISLKDHKKGLMQNLFPASSNASSNATEDCPNP